MSKPNFITAVAFAMAHFLFLVPFVSLSSVFPVGLGMLAMTSMAATLILAARWRIVDHVMGGPDKSYAAHRWLGFFALAGALGHWASASSIGAGIFPALSESGEGAGEIAMNGLIVMTAAAAIRIIPYHLWKASHMLMGPIFLLAAYHTFFVASPLSVGATPWALMAVVSAVGVVAWLQTLLRKAAPTRLVTVARATPFEGGVDVTFTSDRPLPAFKPGQFATLAENRARAEAHPFTMAGGDASSRRFVIRAAGDWTHGFVRDVAPGDTFRVGRGVGRFLPQTGAKRTEQLWVAGGVGITPFLAALEMMEPDDGAPVQLVYCIGSRKSAGGLADIERHATRLPQLRLHVFSKERDTQLTPQRLARIVRYLKDEAQLYVCGPAGLKDMVTQVWKAHGQTGRIHSERFDFRGAYGLTDLIYVGKPVVDVASKVVLRARERTHAAAGA